jgi:hypothetical protein
MASPSNHYYLLVDTHQLFESTTMPVFDRLKSYWSRCSKPDIRSLPALVVPLLALRADHRLLVRIRHHGPNLDPIQQLTHCLGFAKYSRCSRLSPIRALKAHTCPFDSELTPADYSTVMLNSFVNHLNKGPPNHANLTNKNRGLRLKFDCSSHLGPSILRIYDDLMSAR